MPDQHMDLPEGQWMRIPEAMQPPPFADRFMISPDPNGVVMWFMRRDPTQERDDVIDATAAVFLTKDSFASFVEVATQFLGSL